MLIKLQHDVWELPEQEELLGCCFIYTGGLLMVGWGGQGCPQQHGEQIFLKKNQSYEEVIQT